MNTLFQCRLLTMMIVVLFLSVSCSSKNITVTIQNKIPTHSNVSKTLVAGVARTDITPPPGMPMAGHSLMAECGEGVRTRVMARAIYIKPKTGKSVALVQCDLLAGPRIIHHRVAELIAEQTDIESGALLLAGTHTHSAPGNVFSNIFYNQFASHKKGFEQSYYEFASQQIASAVIRAFKKARPAKIATGWMDINGATRNRSMAAYLKNDNIPSETPPSLTEAVNPEMVMIRVDCLDADGVYKPVGAFSNFSLHPNVKNGDTDNLYNGDVFAYIEREVEWGIKEKYGIKYEVVHAATNYAHGDNTPNFKDVKLGYAEMRRLGVIIGKEAFRLFVSLEDTLKDDVTIMFRAREIDLYKENTINNVEICPRPVVGMALTGGANDRPTPFLRHIPGFAPGWPRWIFKGGCQAEKRIVGGIFQPLVIPKKIFPHNLFLQTVKIDNVLLSAVPFEVCNEVGRRIGERAKDSNLENVSKSVVMGCANGYFGYVTTPEEYSLQYYEGGHTLYGPNTGRFIAEHLNRLATEMAQSGSGSDLPETWDFQLKKAKYYPKKYATEGNREIYKNMSPVFNGKTKKSEAYWSFKWLGLPPSEIELHKALVKIETSNDGINWTVLKEDGRAVDDQGYDIAIKCLDNKKKGRGLYEVRWHNPLSSQAVKKRFTILGRKNQKTLHSATF